MEEMSLKYSETVNLVVQDGDHVVFLDKVQGSHQYRAEISIGTRHPIYCTAQGKAIIAFRPENERVAFCKNMKDLKAFSANTITSSEAFKKEICLIRRSGFAINNEEYFAGLNGVAAPIIDYSGFPIYSISVAGPSSRLPKKTLREIGEELKKLCTRISGILGRTE
jgi:IclR family acetate operon transcriptional repressor